MIIGIDIGSTTTKAIALKGSDIAIKIKTKANDAVTSATGAFGKMIIENGMSMKDIEKIIITGAGSSKINNDIFGIPTSKIDELTAIGLGGMFLAKQDNIIIANIGTGTVIIEASKDRIAHFGGSGVGGGTIMGLSKKLLLTENFETIIELASSGDLSRVDLLIEDIMETDISFFNRKTTASNFGKMLDTAEREDIALGIHNMVYQVIGMLSVFAARNNDLSKVVITGNGSNNPIGKNILAGITRMYSVEFEYPANAEYTTAIGAALSNGLGRSGAG
ncbi:pantothenate kinase [Breznakiella homolactica]|uniref:Pantothenate kinase n=1 Tax=Breznakiella homolactica TaxID=2798577 RepID=A0A7T8BB43_9SPIR|nr:pantothenate kinase [Breznakiella homolactica]QQO09650.1 pantothenate kinase [Breznakiella homolactica]